MDLLLTLTNGNNMSCRVRTAVAGQLHQVPVGVTHGHKVLSTPLCPGFGCDRVIFLLSSTKHAVFWGQCACNADNTDVLVVPKQCSPKLRTLQFPRLCQQGRMTRTSDPDWSGGYSIPQAIMPSRETGRKLARRDQLHLALASR